MKIKPLGKRILAKKLEEEERKTAGGIVLPESAKNDKVVRAKVIEVGTDEKFTISSRPAARAAASPLSMDAHGVLIPSYGGPG